jgi:hypothetical protein
MSLSAGLRPAAAFAAPDPDQTTIIVYRDPRTGF